MHEADRAFGLDDGIGLDVPAWAETLFADSSFPWTEDLVLALRDGLLNDHEDILSYMILCMRLHALGLQGALVYQKAAGSQVGRRLRRVVRVDAFSAGTRSSRSMELA